MGRGLLSMCLLTLSAAVPATSTAQSSERSDEGKHAGASLGIALAGYGAAALVLDEPWSRAGAGLLLATAAGGTKELVDLAGTGHPSWADIGWNLVGAATGSLLGLAIDLACDGNKRRPATVDRRGVRLHF